MRSNPELWAACTSQVLAPAVEAKAPLGLEVATKPALGVEATQTAAPVSESTPVRRRKEAWRATTAGRRDHRNVPGERADRL